MIHQPVAPIVFKDWESNRSTVRRNWATPQDAVVIVQHGRLERWKGYDRLLDALGRLRHVPDWTCWFVGSPQLPRERVYLEELRRQATVLGIDNRVRFLGQQVDIPAILAAADIHCQPNTSPEPFGVAFVEAMNAQLPIATTALGSAVEIIDERCGILVPPGDTKALADTLLRLIQDHDLRKRLGSYGPEKARQLSDPITQLNKWYAALREVVHCKGSVQSSNGPCLSIPQRSGLNATVKSPRDLTSRNHNKLRVLHINPGNLYGGVETFLVTLARCRELCPEMVPEFALCVPGRLDEELRQAGVAVHLLGRARFRYPWTVLQARANLRRLLRYNGRFDVVICHQPWTQALLGGVVRKYGIPYVAYFHGSNSGGWPERLARRYQPQLIIAPSRHTLGTVQPLFPETPSSVLYHPLPSHITETKELPIEERLMFRKRLGAQPEDVVILQASRIERGKGPDLVLRALGRLKDLPNWRFWLAGGPQRNHELSFFNELKQLVVELGIEDRVTFLGQRNDVPMLMRAADLYCQGNRGPESFGLSFLEAGYCGLPIITTNLGAVSEWMGPSNGILVAPENVEALTEALRMLITDTARRKAMGIGAKAKAIELCDTSKQLHQLFQLLVQVSHS